MSIRLIFILFFTLTSFKNVDQASSNPNSKWVISENSSLIVNGSTNVNKFSCAIQQYAKADTVFITHDKTSKIILSGVLNIAIKNFDCSNSMMTKQLRKTLKEDQFPTLQIRFLSLKETPSLVQQRTFIKGDVEIVIAGVAKRFEICYQINIAHHSMVLIGNQAINFSDFKLIAPKKIGKLIQAKDELMVAFSLKMELAA